MNFCHIRHHHKTITNTKLQNNYKTITNNRNTKITITKITNNTTLSFLQKHEGNDN